MPETKKQLPRETGHKPEQSVPCNAGLPTSVKIGAHRYEINYQDSLIVDPDDYRVLVGQVIHSAGEIKVQTGKRQSSQIAETLLHEIVHGIDLDRRLELDERQVNQVAAGLLAVMVDNPEIFGEHFSEVFKK